MAVEGNKLSPFEGGGWHVHDIVCKDQIGHLPGESKLGARNENIETELIITEGFSLALEHSGTCGFVLHGPCTH